MPSCAAQTSGKGLRCGSTLAARRLSTGFHTVDIFSSFFSQVHVDMSELAGHIRGAVNGAASFERLQSLV
jgi:hypothetical protein